MKRTYTYQEVKLGELTGFFTFAAALLFALLVAWVSGCGSNIPIDIDEPVSCDVATECVDEVVADFCAPPVDNYDEGYAAGVASVKVCDAKPVTDDECFRFQYHEVDGLLRWVKVRYNCPQARR